MKHYRTRAFVTATLTVVALVASGCTIGQAGPDHENTAEVEEATQDAEPEVSVKDDATEVDPSEPVTVTSRGEGLKDVTMTNEQGYEVEAKFNEDHTEWTTDEVLGYNRTYTVKATDKNGKKTSVQFQTIMPSYTANVALSPLEDAEVGVGQTIAARFSAPIEDRQAAQDAIKVTTEPSVEGAFFWVNNYEVRWRPENYWRPGTKVKVEADIYGKDLGGEVYGESDNATRFTIGDDVRTVVDDSTKQMTVYRNGEALRTIPVSLGRDGAYATPNGIYMIGDKNPSMIMDSETFGLSHEAGGYRTAVDWATQMSYSGIYVHSAPWSVWAQGSQNTSHGCINVTPEAAKWFQDTVKRGDIVEVKNTSGETLSGYDGLGDWNIPWKTWKAGNAKDNTAA
ncbi:Ig-like domain-containing protein [Corynebacterium sp. MSK006]|uniref:L,D-transpeptidase n=1 Tax=Corynebacterium sp. MSK006 TaxID=3050187 RepID=UPI00254F2F11|nr:Ig-like domain-containing protein [Corynebacterium sp. MSK006]MDK8895571.1 Ig-like domain-containing protein [Corynebacterium sp. MSK006]